MNDKNLHSNSLNDSEKALFSKGKIAWEKDQTDIWAELEQKIQTQPKGKSVAFVSQIARWSVAAVFVLLVGLSAFTFLYTKTFESVPGQKIMAELPDGSTVELNAGSSLKYYPIKWNFQRKLQFEGEAFFTVEKGKKFEVVSSNGTTQVVGTSFNIYARNNDYRVTCLSGKVKVTNNLEKSQLLSPNEHVEIENGKLVMKTNYKANKAISWKNNQFDFAGRPLKEVVSEIERQFDVDIQLHPKLYQRNFTSNFYKPNTVEEVLDYVCKSMQLKYVKQSESLFLIVEKN